MLGHGNSPRSMSNPLDYAFSELFEDLKTIFSKFQLKRNFVVSHSMGSMFMLRYFSIHWKSQNKSEFLDFEKCVLLGASSTPPKVSNFGRNLFWYTPNVFLEWSRPLFRNSFSTKAYHSSTPKELVDREALINNFNPMGVLKYIICQLPSESLNLEDLKHINSHILFATGETDGLTPFEGCKPLLQFFPNSKAQIIEKTSHNLMLENPYVVCKLIEQFFFGL